MLFSVFLCLTCPDAFSGVVKLLLPAKDPYKLLVHPIAITTHPYSRKGVKFRFSKYTLHSASDLSNGIKKRKHENKKQILDGSLVVDLPHGLQRTAEVHQSPATKPCR